MKTKSFFFNKKKGVAPNKCNDKNQSRKLMVQIVSKDVTDEALKDKCSTMSRAMLDTIHQFTKLEIN